MSTCLAGSLGLSPVSMERFVHRGKDGRILDVDEFQVAKALLAGEVELVSQEVDSKHLFDLCLQFGHQSTAVAMMSYGVPGCVFKGPRSLPPHAAAPAGAAEDFCHSGCNCRHWVTCIACSWGVPEDEGVWMEDWDASLLDAKNAAESVAAMPLLRTLLEACRSEADCPRIVTEEAMAYLLDVAILVGDTELARCCAKRCTQFPLRRWRFQEFVRIRIKADAHPCVRAEIQEEDVLLAALAAGLALHCFSYYDDPWEPLCLSFSVSILEAIVLSGDAELWRRVQSLQLPLRLWPTQKGGGDVARFLLERSGGQVSLSLESMHRAERAGLELGSFQMRVPVLCQGCGLFAFFSRLSIQDLAILFGQSDCSRLCGGDERRGDRVDRVGEPRSEASGVGGEPSMRILWFYVVGNCRYSHPLCLTAGAPGCRSRGTSRGTADVLPTDGKLFRHGALSGHALLGSSEVGANISGGVGVDLRGRSTVTFAGPRGARGRAASGQVRSPKSAASGGGLRVSSISTGLKTGPKSEAAKLNPETLNHNPPRP